jgi:uncharacterized surface protein with fasciclin (FAS1) repeats
MSVSKTLACIALLLACASGANGTATSIAALVESTPSTSILLAAVKAAGLADVLAKPDLAYTVFAPTDDAFESFLAAFNATISDLLSSASDATSDLLKILDYHVLAKVYKAEDLKSNEELPTLLAGQDLKVTLDKSTVYIDAYESTAEVFEANIAAGMSIVHLITEVLIPDLAAAEAPAPSSPSTATKG